MDKRHRGHRAGRVRRAGQAPAALLLAVSGACPAQAGTYPARPVRLVAGFAAGGPTWWRAPSPTMPAARWANPSWSTTNPAPTPSSRPGGRHRSPATGDIDNEALSIPSARPARLAGHGDHAGRAGLPRPPCGARGLSRTPDHHRRAYAPGGAADAVVRLLANRMSAAGPQRDRRQSRGRQRHHRRGLRGQGARRRLHPAVRCHAVLHQSAPVPEDALCEPRCSRCRWCCWRRTS